MEYLVPLAAKSLLIAGITLLVLQLMKRRSAADRSWVAHLGLGAIALLPIAFFVLPQIQIETALMEPAPVSHSAAPVATAIEKEVASSTSTFPVPTEATTATTPVDWVFWAYAAPAGLLLLLTLIALLRLVALKSKANVLVEPTWLTALARAQRRMGFKHGTALLTSNELRSPISWGLMRPVILLNDEAAEAHDEAEAIIAHELAHVARLDWIKLLLSRVTVAMFWFNPLVWMLAREAHQLREEAADDAVLGSNIEDTEYARLLVGIARHECRGLLLGAHGVAPARTSLARRVQRVLDAALDRAPGGWRWTAAAGFFAAGMAVPLATLHFVPMTPAAANAGSVGGKTLQRAEVAAPAAAVQAAPAAPAAAATTVTPAEVAATAQTVVRARNGGTIDISDRHTVLRSPDGGTITVYPADRTGRSRAILRSPDGATISVADARSIPGIATATAIAGKKQNDAIARAVELKAVGATPDYTRALRSAAPHLKLDHDDIVQLAALGVSPAYLRELASAGYPRLGADDIAQAKAMGITGAYVKAIAAAGYGRLPIEKLVELKAVGVTPQDIERFRRAGRGLPSVNRLVEMKALGVTPEDLDAVDSP